MQLEEVLRDLESELNFFFLVKLREKFFNCTYMSQFNLFADQVCAHHRRKNMDALFGKSSFCAFLDAMPLGHHGVLSGRNNVSPIGLHAN